MISLLQDGLLPLQQEFELLDAGGGWVARVVGLPDGTVKVEPDPFGLTGFWKREELAVSIVDAMGTPIARFVSEGLDSRSRKLFWGWVKVGPHWLEHCLRVQPRPSPRISFCTTSRNRLHHVRETLPQNIADNRDYPNLEFVLLDYNSEDGLGDWVRQELGDEIASGRLSYYLAPQPTHFHATHSRNMSIRLASGDIVCVVDADNYTGRGFASYLADHVEPDNFLIGCRIEGDDLVAVHDQGCVGRYALYKTTFFDVGGMDEAHVGWGYDDLDMYQRLRAKGYRCQSIDPRYARCIPHDDHERRKELRYQDIGRDRTGGDGSVWVNARRSQANLDAGRIVLNDGRIGCGEVVKNFGESTVVVRERRNPVISICIACGDRSDEVRRGLGENLHATRFYPNLEFVIVDSPAGALDEWLRQEFPRELDTGRVVYCRMVTPYGQRPCENPVRQRNIAARLASGDILCLASPSDRFSAGFPSPLAHRFHGGPIAESLDGAGVVLSRHLFYLASGLDQDLPAGDAEKDLLTRIERRLDGRDPPVWSRSGLEARDFGGGTTLRKGEPVIVSPHRFPRISFTTACKGSLHRLKETLPRNLADNRDYPNLEFVILHYGDGDDVHEWLRTEMAEQLEAGRLAYHRASEEQQLHHPRAMNMAMRLATGELLCNVDVGALIGHHFAFHVAQRLQEDDFLVAGLDQNEKLDGICGRRAAANIAMRRPVFYATGGFDEGMFDDGGEDRDLCERLRTSGYRGVSIEARFLDGRAPGGGKVDEGLTACTTEKRSRRHIEKGAPVRNGGFIGNGLVLRNFETSPIEVKPFRFRKISFCITCMDRLHHLSRTLPRNLADNLDYPDIEIVLLDYNSTDGLEAWAKQELRTWIEAGRLVYFKTTDPGYFHRSHARNLAFRLATGEIVCTIDADNFTGRGFAHYVNERFDRYDRSYLRPDFEGAHVRLTDAFGRICVRKQDFLRIEGYDEQLADYGFEDLDLCRRLEKGGLTPRFIEDDGFLSYIHHGNRDRVANGPILSQASLLLRGHELGKKWESIVYLLEDGDFIWQGPRLDGLSPEGRWQMTDGGMLLTCGQGGLVSLRASENGECYLFEQPVSDLRLRRSDDLDFFSDAVKELAMEKNQRRYRSNLRLAASRVNSGRFGQGNVSRNFSPHAVSVEAIERKAGEQA
jgi:cellulose synthase/poly-beta-1,6-N-acetylglucosamine synthase-like glycosyltransferase